MANDEMRELWNSDLMAGWTQHAERYDGQLGPYAHLVVGAAEFNETDRILDVGCGTGALTRMAAARCPHGTATGVDISRPMVEAARHLADGLANVHFVVADAQTDDLVPAEAVISRFGVMFFDDPATAFANLHQLTEPDGQLTFVCWRGALENEWATVPMGAAFEVVGPPDPPAPGAPGPFAFENRNHLAYVLTEAGWADIRIEPDDRTVLVGGGLDADGATDFILTDGMGRSIVARASAEQQAALRDSVRSALAPYETSEGVRMKAAAWLVRAHCRND